MINGLKPYPAMKDIGVPWLESVPEHWKVQSLGSITTARGVRGKPDLPLLSVVREKGVILRSSMAEGENHNFIPDELSNYKVARQGDLVINKMKAWQGSLGLAPVTGIVSPAYYVFDFRIADIRYGQALLRSKPYVAFFAQASDGVRIGQWDLSIRGMKRIPVLTPPMEEQSAIVRFLDHADRRIRRSILAKQKLIKLLEEQKQTIVHRAVTRGINPGVALKPSNVAWLPEAPAHWTWTPIKRLVSRMDYGTSEAGKGDGKIRLLTMGNVQKGEIILPRTGDLDAVPEALLLEQNDLLFVRTNGNPDLVGKVGIFRGQVADNVSFASYLVRLRVKKEYSPEWLHMVLNSASFWPFARSHALVNLQTNLNSTRYGQLAISVPPKEEQVRIVDWVNKESKPVATAIQRTERETGLIREYRTRLVADVVTGKLDVRAAAANLPEEAHEPEALDEDALIESEDGDTEADLDATPDEAEA